MLPTLGLPSAPLAEAAAAAAAAGAAAARARRNEIPVALACAQPEAHVSAALQRADLHQHLDVVVSAEDTGAPELEWTLSHAAQRLGRPPLRCVVFCDSNVAVEAAHELGMKSVAVAGDRPLWQFAGADLVVRSLAQVTLLSLKRLFGAEELVATTRAVGDDGGEEDELDEEEGLGYGAGARRREGGRAVWWGADREQR